MSTVAERYAEFAASLITAEIDDTVRHHAVRAVVDWMASAVPGGVIAPSTPARKAIADQLGFGACRLIPDGSPATAQAAALINGTASHTVEFDDIYRDGLYHPGAPTIAAALAAAEFAGASGEQFLRGVIAGYEVSNRIAVAVNPRHYDFWHTTATVGCFGAAAACSVILGLNAAQTAHALASSGTMAAGLQQAFRADAMSKPFHSGRAAEAGLLSARLAEQGVTGALDVLEGPRGFAKAMSAQEVDWQAALADLGQDWTITRMTFKNHGACGHVHAAVDAAQHLVKEHGIAVSDIARIIVGSYGKSVEICGNPTPKTDFEAKFSLPYCVAAGLVLGSVRRAAFEPEALANTDIRALASKVDHSVDEGCEAAFPKARSAKVAIETVDGNRVEHFAPTRRGDPDSPLSDEELSGKFNELAGPIIGEQASADLLQKLWGLSELDNISALTTAQPHQAAAE